MRGEHSSRNRFCYLCEQRFAFKVFALSIFHFVRSLRGNGTGYAVIWLKELGSREKGIQG